MVMPDCGRKRQSLAHFQDDAWKHRGKGFLPVILRALDSGLVPVGDAGPSGAGSERGGEAIAAHRLGQDQPEAKQHHDQREAKPQPLLHVRPLPFAMPDQRDTNKGQD
jgi:hypothetical protein